MRGRRLPEAAAAGVVWCRPLGTGRAGPGPAEGGRLPRLGWRFVVCEF